MFHTALSSSLWMGDLDEDMDEQAVVSAFAQFGEAVVAVKLLRNAKHSSLSKPSNYCFVEFSDVDTAQRVLHRLNGKYISSRPGKRFKLNPASYGREHELLPEFSLYVGDLSWEIDDYELFAFFQKRYKSVRGAKVVADQGGKSKGYGFIRFSEEIDQQRALMEMQHMTGLGRRPIKVSLASIKSNTFLSARNLHRRRPNEMPHTAPPMPSAGGYYAGQYSWGGYNFHYNQPHSQPSSTSATHPPDFGVSQAYSESIQNSLAIAESEDDSEVLEDPGLEINVGKENREFIESSESFFAALENARWQPLDNILSEVPD